MSFLNSWELRSGEQNSVFDPVLNLGMKRLSLWVSKPALCPLDPRQPKGIAT